MKIYTMLRWKNKGEVPITSVVFHWDEGEGDRLDEVVICSGTHEECYFTDPQKALEDCKGMNDRFASRGFYYEILEVEV